MVLLEEDANRCPLEEATAVTKGCYLASGSKDQTIRVWSYTRSRGKIREKFLEDAYRIYPRFLHISL